MKAASFSPREAHRELVAWLNAHDADHKRMLTELGRLAAAVEAVAAQTKPTKKKP